MLTANFVHSLASSRAKLGQVLSRGLLMASLFLVAISSALGQNSPAASTTQQTETAEFETTVLNFDELAADDVVGNALGRCAANLYRQHGLLMETCDLTGTPRIGRNVRLINPVAGFEVLGGPDQPFISPYNFVIPAGRGTHDLLLTFDEPVVAVSVVSDRFRGERADLIRLMILEPIQVPTESTKNRNRVVRQADFRVLAGTEKWDNAVSAPDNILSVDLKGEPFQYVLFECTTESEGFDDLKFVRRKRAKPPEEKPETKEQPPGQPAKVSAPSSN